MGKTDKALRLQGVCLGVRWVSRVVMLNQQEQTPLQQCPNPEGSWGPLSWRVLNIRRGSSGRRAKHPVHPSWHSSLLIIRV